MSTVSETYEAIGKKSAEESAAHGQNYYETYKSLFKVSPLSSSASIGHLYEHFDSWFLSHVGLSAFRAFAEMGAPMAADSMLDIKATTLEAFCTSLSDEWHKHHPCR